MKNIALLVTTLTLAACGGSGSSDQDSSAFANEAQGVYQGLTDTGKGMTALIRDDDEFYILVQESDSRRDDLSGVIFGTATAEDGNFVSDDAVVRNLNGGEAESYTVSASYVAEEYLTGTITHVSSGGAVGFTVSSVTDGESYPDLEQLSGDYYTGFYKGVLGAASESVYASVHIDEDGSLVGTLNLFASCDFQGTLSPRSGSHLFNVSISFPNEGCFLGNEELKGVSYHDEEQNQLFLAAPNPDKSGGLFFSGVQGY